MSSTHQHQDSSSAAAFTPMSAEELAARLHRWGDRMRRVLDAHGTSVSEAARICHVPRSTFARRLASGNVYVDWFMYLADAYGDVDPWAILKSDADAA